MEINMSIIIKMANEYLDNIGNGLSDSEKEQIEDFAVWLSGINFDWQCPHCGAILNSSNEHCPCEYGGE
jgi:rubrerythrin